VKGEPEYLPLIAKPRANAQSDCKSIAADSYGDKGCLCKPHRFSSSKQNFPDRSV
jgi:hypothetical protein